MHITGNPIPFKMFELQLENQYEQFTLSGVAQGRLFGDKFFRKVSL